jgi:RimJ/RimL family protein N-acetyltransferase
MPEIPYPEPPLSDGVVAMRPWRPGDAAAITAAVQDPEIPRWTSVPSPYSTDDARDHLERSELERTAGTSMNMPVLLVESGELAGACGMGRVDWHHRSAEIGYWVAAGARRKGVGTRAVVLLSRWALRDLGLERLQLFANPDNEPSQRVALAAGFTREGLLRSYRVRKGGREDLVVFSLLPGDL